MKKYRIGIIDFSGLLSIPDLETLILGDKIELKLFDVYNLLQNSDELNSFEFFIVPSYLGSSEKSMKELRKIIPISKEVYMYHQNARDTKVIAVRKLKHLIEKYLEQRLNSYKSLSEQFTGEVIKLQEKRGYVGLALILFDDNSNSVGLDFVQLSILNKKLLELTDKLFLKNDIKVLQIRTGSIEEIIGGNLSQIITVCGLLFASAKGVFHLIKERKSIKKIGYENQLLLLDINDKESDKAREEKKKKNIEQLLINKPKGLNKLLNKLDAEFIDYVLKNFEINPFDEVNSENVDEILNLTEFIVKQFPVSDIRIERVEEKTVPNIR